MYPKGFATPPPGQEQELPLNLEGWSLKNGVKIPAPSIGIARSLVAVLPFGAYSVNRGGELFDEGLDGLRMQRKAPFEMRFQLRFGGPSPMAFAAEPMDLYQTRPQVAR
jgi:hypothetical protein